MTADVEITECAEPTELYQQYAGQTNAQPAYIELDLRAKTLLADYDSEVGGAVPAAVFHGFQRRYSIPVLTGSAANRVMAEIKPLAARIVGDWAEEWDGSNMVADLGKDALEAEEEIETFLGCYQSFYKDQGFDESDLVAIWDLPGAVNGEEQQHYGITDETSNERLDEIENDILAGLASIGDSGVAVCPELTDHLRKIRDELVEEANKPADVVWSVMRGPSPGARAVKPGSVGVTVPDAVLTWAESYGLSAEADIYILVAPQDEAEADGNLVNEVDWTHGSLPAAEVRKIRAELASEK